MRPRSMGRVTQATAERSRGDVVGSPARSGWPPFFLWSGCSVSGTASRGLAKEVTTIRDAGRGSRHLVAGGRKREKSQVALSVAG